MLWRALGLTPWFNTYSLSKVSIPGVLTFPIDWPLQGSTKFTFANPGLTPWFNTYSLSQEEAKAFQRFWSHFRRATSKAVLANAVRRFSYAGERERPDDRLVDLMIAAESLFLGGEDDATDRGELRYRLALRAAFFLDHRDYSRREVFDHTRRAYDGRSAIVHGGGEPKSSTLRSPTDAPMSLHDFSELTAGLMRMALKKGIDVAAGTQGTKGSLLDWNALIIPP
jgi:Apea-like HEPN